MDDVKKAQKTFPTIVFMAYRDAPSRRCL